MADIVLVLSQAGDLYTTGPVCEELQDRGAVPVVFDFGSFPARAVLKARNGAGWWTGELLGPHGVCIPLEQIRSIWYRRPQKFQAGEALTEGERQFGQREARAAMGGVLRSLRCKWVNRLGPLAQAGYKPLQLARAEDCGLRVPKTAITNCPERVAEFLRECGGTAVYKPLSDGVLPEEPGDGVDTLPGVVYSSVVTLEALDGAEERIRAAPCLFQELVKPGRDIRVSVFGKRVFAVEILVENESTEPIDWRTASRIQYIHHTLDERIGEQLVSYMSNMGLEFGAIDLVRREHGEYVFLEVNPNGQWMFLEKALDLGMSAAMADLLWNV